MCMYMCVMSGVGDGWAVIDLWLPCVFGPMQSKRALYGNLIARIYPLCIYTCRACVPCMRACVRGMGNHTNHPRRESDTCTPCVHSARSFRPSLLRSVQFTTRPAWPSLAAARDPTLRPDPLFSFNLYPHPVPDPARAPPPALLPHGLAAAERARAVPEPLRPLRRAHALPHLRIRAYWTSISIRLMLACMPSARRPRSRTSPSIQQHRGAPRTGSA